jgi:hypothetical protein
MFSLLDLQSYSIYEHTTNSSNTLRYFSIRIKIRINLSIRKIELEEDNRYKRGKVYGGEVKEEEEDEHEAHKPARVFDEPLKKP